MNDAELIWERIQNGNTAEYTSREGVPNEEDSVYLSEKYVFKPEDSMYKQANILSWFIREARQNDVNVAPIIPTSGNYVAYKRLQSDTEDASWDYKTTQKLGAQLRRLHENTYTHGFGRVTDVNPVQTRFDTYSEYVSHNIDMADSVQDDEKLGPYATSCIEYINSHHIPEPGAASICHHDLHRQNALPVGKTVYLIDFGEAILGSGKEDLAKACLKQTLSQYFRSGDDIDYQIPKHLAAGYGAPIHSLNPIYFCIVALRELEIARTWAQKISSRGDVTEDQALDWATQSIDAFLPEWMGE